MTASRNRGSAKQYSRALATALNLQPLVVLLTKPNAGNPPPGIAADEWKRISEEKRQQKIGLADLSSNSKLVVAESSGHHIQLDEPSVVTDAIHMVIDAVRRRSRLSR